MIDLQALETRIRIHKDSSNILITVPELTALVRELRWQSKMINRAHKILIRFSSVDATIAASDSWICDLADDE